MLKRPKKKELTAEQVASITEASASQTGKVSTPKSYDPNYPVLDTPINQKYLIYVPNHLVTTPDGGVSLRMDKFSAHPIRDGRSFGNIRCTSGLIDESLGLDGSCPLCDASQEIWDLYHKEYEAIAKAKGISVDAPEAKEGLKEDRKKLAKEMIVKSPEVWYTFPVVLIECEEKDGKLTTTPKLTADGQLVGKPFFYSIRERTYKEKWEKSFESIPTDDDVTPVHPGGRWVVLDYTYESKDGKYDKMQSANHLSLLWKPNYEEKYSAWAEYFDKMTEDWTPEVAMNTVVLDILRDMDEMNEVTDTVMKPVRDKLAIYALGDNVGEQKAIGVSGNAESALEGFGAMPVDESVTLEKSSGIE